MMKVSHGRGAIAFTPYSRGWISIRLMGLGLMVLFIFGGVAHPRSGGEDPLWQRAETYMAKHLWVPGEVWANEKVFNRKGGLEEERTLLMGLSARPDHTIYRHLIAAEENGEEIAAAVRPEIEGPTTLTELVGDSPFSPAKGQQVRVNHWPNGAQRQIGSHTCIGFGYELTTAETQVQGVAWLEQTSGLPVELTAEVKSVPFKEDGVKITAYRETNHFSLDDGGECRIRQTRIQMEIAVWGFKGRVETHQRYSRHWLWLGGGDG
jgi:hypothetical protein